MVNGNTKVKVFNNGRGTVVYSIPELHVTRTFLAGSSKEVTAAELRALDNEPGGKALMQEFLSIQNEELLEEFGITAEPEYNWDKTDVEALLKSGSVARLQDALQFAPESIISLIKKMAVDTELSDMNKREAILEATGFNVTNAINNNKAEKAAAENEKVEAKPKATRRAPDEAPKTTK